MSLHREIVDVLNKHSAENRSNTPDFILAGFLLECLAAFNAATEKRAAWHDLEQSKEPSPDPQLEKQLARFEAEQSKGSESSNSSAAVVNHRLAAEDTRKPDSGAGNAGSSPAVSADRSPSSDFCACCVYGAPTSCVCGTGKATP